MLLNHKHIFIVEDNLQNRIVFQMSLIRHGATVDFERYGAEASYYIQRTPHIDLVIMDLMLAHGVSGFEIFDEIRTLPNLQHVPIIAVSAMDPAVAIPRVREKGFAGFIAKPIDSVMFPRQLAMVLNGTEVWPNSPQEMR